MNEKEWTEWTGVKGRTVGMETRERTAERQVRGAGRNGALEWTERKGMTGTTERE